MSTESFRSPRRRRTVNEINMVPFIDVMLVLLIIFMVTAPMLTPGAINVPSAGKSTKPPMKHVAYVLLSEDGSIRLKAGKNEQILSLQDLGAATVSWQAQESEESAVLIQADKTLAYEHVVAAMGELQRAGVKRIALGVKSAAK
ncbi:MAG: biopolymer transporter ExbD [Comamonas sp.]|jgi:biopolymer transport protein TolR|uniref:ExbD/TolR family protein n=1 Tax=Comamonas denitrificans TaxID=117506 RepID=UPI001B5F61D3|nr:biopolymer transporter ExbD [Comamonas sp.]MCZ2106082.1 biopolymer transporter ExbD [Burkholderiales bacterium]HRL38796.1 biopolymer transporter ExbD [Comamonas denitrificans]MBP6292996.1 biopolymer transporter ExbD [Comamonas sp.]MBP7840497.1 biopolymer transporter ExbD [Comamonas sp.]